MCVSVCVLKLADLCVCEISQSQHQLAQGTLTEGLYTPGRISRALFADV